MARDKESSGSCDLGTCAMGVNIVLADIVLRVNVMIKVGKTKTETGLQAGEAVGFSRPSPVASRKRGDTHLHIQPGNSELKIGNVPSSTTFTWNSW